MTKKHAWDDSLGLEKILKDYRKNGYVVIRDFFDEKDMKGVLEETDSIISNLPLYSPFVEYRLSPWGGQILERIMPVSAKSFFFQKLSMNERIIEISKTLLETKNDIRFLKDKITFKPPGQGGYWVHQDLSWWINDGISEALTFMLVLDENNQFNWGLQFLPGSHGHLLTDANKPWNLDYEELSSVNQSDWVLPELRSGDAIFFSALVVHKSETNISDDWRRIYYSTYYKINP